LLETIFQRSLGRYLENELSEGQDQVNHPLLVTLDHNCIVALEKNEEPDADTIRQLIAFQQKGIIKIVVGWLPC
jgi:hypothetical protein